MLPPRMTGWRRVGGQDRRGQRRRRRLALRAGHADGRHGTEAQEQVRLRHERRDRPVAAGARVDQRAQRRAQAGLGGREVGRDRRRGRDERRVRPGRRRVDVRTEHQPHPAVAQRGDRLGELRRPCGRRRPSPEPRRRRRSAPARSRSGRGRGPSPAGRAARRRGRPRASGRRGRARPASSSSSLQSVDRGEEEGHAEERGEDPDDPEADRDLLLVPAAELEVMMDRGSSGRAACRRTA